MRWEFPAMLNTDDYSLNLRDLGGGLASIFTWACNVLVNDQIDGDHAFNVVNNEFYPYLHCLVHEEKLRMGSNFCGPLWKNTPYSKFPNYWHLGFVHL